MPVLISLTTLIVSNKTWRIFSYHRIQIPNFGRLQTQITLLCDYSSQPGFQETVRVEHRPALRVFQRTFAVYMWTVQFLQVGLVSGSPGILFLFLLGVVAGHRRSAVEGSLLFPTPFDHPGRFSLRFSLMNPVAN